MLSFVVGLASAFTIYAFFYVLRESLRVLSFGFENYPNILSESDRNFYNIFFAGLSIIYANSIVVNFLFSKPQNVMNRFNSKRKRILNDQIFLSFNFSYLFTKIGLVFGVFSMCCMDFNFIPFFKPFSVLLLVVLYLETWKNLSRVFKKNRFQIQCIHLLIIVLLVFGLSRINIVDYNALDAISLSKNPKIDLPHSAFFNDKGSRFDLEIDLKLKINEHNELDIYTKDKPKISLNEVAYFITQERASRRYELVPFLSVFISADKNMNIKHVKMLEAELFSVNQRKVIYEVFNPEAIISRFDKRGIAKMITESFLEIKLNNEIPMPPILPDYSEYYHFDDTLQVTIQEHIKINGKGISQENLTNEFKKYINPKTLVLYNYKLDAKYQDYIHVLASHFSAAYQLRQSDQTIFIQNEYESNETYEIEQQLLKEKYPIMIREKINH